MWRFGGNALHIGPRLAHRVRNRDFDVQPEPDTKTPTSNAEGRKEEKHWEEQQGEETPRGWWDQHLDVHDLTAIGAGAAMGHGLLQFCTRQRSDPRNKKSKLAEDLLPYGLVSAVVPGLSTAQTVLPSTHPFYPHSTSPVRPGTSSGKRDETLPDDGDVAHRQLCEGLSDAGSLSKSAERSQPSLPADGADSVQCAKSSTARRKEEALHYVASGKAIEAAEAQFDRTVAEYQGSVNNIIGVDMMRRGLWTEGIRYIAQAADKGSPSALYNLGVCSHKGLGTPKSITKALELWKAAAEERHGEAAFMVAVGHIKGVGGMKKDMDLGAKYMSMAAQANVPQALKYSGQITGEKYNNSSTSVPSSNSYGLKTAAGAEFARDSGTTRAEMKFDESIGISKENGLTCSLDVMSKKKLGRASRTQIL